MNKTKRNLFSSIIASGFVLIMLFLTACGMQTPLPAAAASSPPSTVTPSATRDLTPTEPNGSVTQRLTQTFTSPSNLWRVEVLRKIIPSEPDERKEYNRFQVSKTDGSKNWLVTFYTPQFETIQPYSQFDWARDERYAYFYKTGASGGCGDPVRNHLYRIDFEKEQVQTVEPFGDQGPPNFSLSPDLSQLAYIPWDRKGPTAEIVLYNFGSRAEKRIPFEPLAAEGWLPTPLVWSPDGKQLAFSMRGPWPWCVNVDQVRYETAVVDLAAGTARKVTAPPHMLVSGWTPDGQLEWSSDLPAPTSTPTVKPTEDLSPQTENPLFTVGMPW